jgi:hypothetical protein
MIRERLPVGAVNQRDNSPRRFRRAAMVFTAEELSHPSSLVYRPPCSPVIRRKGTWFTTHLAYLQLSFVTSK